MLQEERNILVKFSQASHCFRVIHSFLTLTAFIFRCVEQEIEECLRVLLEESRNVRVGLSELLHDRLKESGVLSNCLSDLLELRVLLELLQLLKAWIASDATGATATCQRIDRCLTTFTDLRNVP